jgi:hypothetical protein
VPNLGRIAREEIDRRAARLHIPKLLVDGALKTPSGNGQSYQQRLQAVRSEKQLSELYDEVIARVPLGKTLLGGLNPVHTGGPMQVSIDFAEKHAKDYPYSHDGTIRQEVFSRRGGMYFGIAHLLGYPQLRAPAVPLRRFQRGLVRQPQCGVPGGIEQGHGGGPGTGRRLDRAGFDHARRTEQAARKLGGEAGAA